MRLVSAQELEGSICAQMLIEYPGDHSFSSLDRGYYSVSGCENRQILFWNGTW